jgi:hypothetical protein
LSKPSDPKWTNGASRTEHPFFDFNDPLHDRAAKGVTPEALSRLFKRLDHADENFGETGRTQRAAALAALEAVVEFLATTAFNTNGRFSRPLELLYAELKNRPDGNKRILPAAGGGSGGINSRSSDQHVKGAAAFAVEFMHSHAGYTVEAAAGDIANALHARGFHFAARRDDKGQSITAWRRDYQRPHRGGSKVPSAAKIYKGLCTTPPVKITGDAATDAAAIREWLGALLGRAGYGAVI